MDRVEHILMVWQGLGHSAHLVFGLLMVLQVRISANVTGHFGAS